MTVRRATTSFGDDAYRFRDVPTVGVGGAHSREELRESNVSAVHSMRRV
jgi:hypothetical protein